LEKTITLTKNTNLLRLRKANYSGLSEAYITQINCALLQ